MRGPPSPGAPPSMSGEPDTRHAGASYADAADTKAYLGGITIEQFVKSHGLGQYLVHFTDVADDLEDLVEGLRGREFEDFVEQAEMNDRDASRLRAALAAVR